MKKALFLTTAGLFLTVFAVLLATPAWSMGSTPERTDVYYVCDCGADCQCDSVSKEPGKCKCGKEMVQMHLLDIQDGMAKFCTCGGDCECKMDPNKCGCGKPVKMVNLKGKYICACGKDCKCGTISDKPGKCKCGQEMKMVE